MKLLVLTSVPSRRCKDRYGVRRSKVSTYVHPAFCPRSAANCEFLEIRAVFCKSPPRWIVSAGVTARAADDPRFLNLKRGLSILQNADSNRAEQIQLLFSRTYDEHWRQNLGAARARS